MQRSDTVGLGEGSYESDGNRFKVIFFFNLHNFIEFYFSFTKWWNGLEFLWWDFFSIRLDLSCVN